MKSFAALVVLALSAQTVTPIELSVENSCGYTIWLATTPNFGQQPLPGGSVRVEPGQKHVYQVFEFISSPLLSEQCPFIDLYSLKSVLRVN